MPKNTPERRFAKGTGLQRPEMAVHGRYRKPCPDCGKIHAPVGAPQGNVAGSAGGVSTNYFYCENCKSYHPQPKQVNLEL